VSAKEGALSPAQAGGRGRRGRVHGTRFLVPWRPLLSLLYYVYAYRLLSEVRSRPRPQHVGIILDGNRRHGRSVGITEPRALYDLGARKLDEVLDWCVELGIRTVTLWVFSTDNFRRPAAEVSGILASVAAKLTELADDPIIHRRRVRVRAIGKLGMLPEPVAAAIALAEEATEAYHGIELNIAVAYGGREEITDAVRALLTRVAKSAASLDEAIDAVTPEAIARHLYTAGLPDPDLIIRTSGERRLSNFLLWQAAYAEFLFVETLWPDFTREQFLAALESFARRERRFGAVTPEAVA
jgi:short-chain Z-isoprenyl diphosphate synthase